MKKYEIISWNLADHSQISLVEKSEMKTIAHFYIDSYNPDYEEKLKLANKICELLNSNSCPLCHGKGEYTIGGSFGGSVQIIKCNCK